jgi:DNA transposition AAA+ family ATPase
MVIFYGPAGWGKSFAAQFAMNHYDATLIQCMSTWTTKAVLTAIAKELSLPPAPTTYGLTDQICEYLALSGKPLIIDEIDHVVRRKNIEIIRDLYEGSQIPIMLIGEERLPENLKRWERFHSRVLDFVPAQQADAEDAAILASFYARRIRISAALLAETAKMARGSIRRICVNLDRMEEAALASGVKEMDLPDFKKLVGSFFTGDAPARKV